jgi:hypothetical protein
VLQDVAVAVELGMAAALLFYVKDVTQSVSVTGGLEYLIKIPDSTFVHSFVHSLYTFLHSMAFQPLFAQSAATYKCSLK